jgi:acetylornithine deacetylase
MSISPTLRNSLSSEVERLAPQLIAAVQDAVRVPSVVGSEAAMHRHMVAVYEGAGLGLSVEAVAPKIETLRDHPGFVDTQMSYDDRLSTVARWRGAGGGRSLVLNGHYDVVSPGPVEKWSHDPWGAEIVGDWLYGRGSGDMKAGLIANLFALKAINSTGLRLAGDVMLQAVIDEEAGGAGGTLACLEQGHRGDAMLIPEPEALNMTVAHAGVCYFRVRVTGRQAHAAFAHRGVNAISRMARIVTALARFDEERGATVFHALLDNGTGRSCHLNVGTIHAGEWPSTVPAEAVIECRLGFVPGETLQEVRALVLARIAAVAAEDPWLIEHPPQVEWFGWQASPWEQDVADPFITAVRSESEAVLGRAVRFQGATGGIDCRYAAYYGMPAVCIGPIAENIHGVDERVNIPSIIATTKLVAASVLSWCGVAQ